MQFLDIPVRVACAPAIGAVEQLTAAAAANRMGAAHLRHDRRAENGRRTVLPASQRLLRRKKHDPDTVWGTFYDIRRYGGLQIFLRAVLGGSSLVLSSAGEPVADHLDRLAAHGVTHLSGTPTHWRRALMSPSIRKISPRYVRLSGEIADQAILDDLRSAFPKATVSHAYRLDRGRRRVRSQRRARRLSGVLCRGRSATASR